MVCGILVAQRAAQRTPPKITWIEIQDILKKGDRAQQEEHLRKQIVQTEKGREITKPLPNAFLGEKNQAVDRETVSKDHMTQLGHEARTSAPNQARQEAAPKQKTQAKTQAVPAAPLGNLGLPILPKLDTPKTAQEAEARDRRWADFGNLPQDYIKGLKEGEHTALNTKEFVFYGYFQRIRERLDRAWIPILRSQIMKIYNTGRQLASDMDHTTRVMVILNSGGEIVKVQILSESGTRDLDDAAVQAFNQAGPFPNPPKGIAGADGYIQIPWEFILRT